MTNPDESKPNGAENEKNRSELEDSTTIDLDGHDESKAQLINGGAGGGDEHPEGFKTAIVDPGAASSDGEVSFNGLGKDEVMQYANDPFWVKLRWAMFILFWIGWLAMLVTAVAIIVLAPRCPHRPDLKWYHTDNVYEVVGKSFKDSDNNGLGDFQGLKDQMDEYIEDEDNLNTKAIWLSSVYVAEPDTSGMAVMDHKALDPTFVKDDGKFRSWVKKMRKEGKKVIMDLIPNHTSKNHTWFMKSVKKEGKYKDYYVWSESSKAPNNWKQSDESTSAWSFDDTRKAWYLHQVNDMPDLNLNNPAVVEEIKEIMKYWFDAGISGFYIWDLEYLVSSPNITVDDDAAFSHTRNYVGNLAFLEELRKVAEDFSDKPGRERVLIGSVSHANRTQIEAYWGTEENERLHIVSPVLKEISPSCDANCMKRMIERVISEDTEKEQWLGLQVGNQRTDRISTRLSSPDDGHYKHRLLLWQALQLLLPGTPLVYYGDEFGQRNGEGPIPQKYQAPMQWDNTKNAGFTDEDSTPWTQLSDTFKTENVGSGKVHFKDMTPLQGYQQMSSLRKEESLQFGKTKLCTVGDKVLMFSRKAHRFPSFVVFVNSGDMAQVVSPSDLRCLTKEEDATVRFHSRDEDVGKMISLEDYGLHLEPYDVVVLEFPAED